MKIPTLAEAQYNCGDPLLKSERAGGASDDNQSKFTVSGDFGNGAMMNCKTYLTTSDSVACEMEEGFKRNGSVTELKSRAINTDLRICCFLISSKNQNYFRQQSQVNKQECYRSYSSRMLHVSHN